MKALTKAELKELGKVLDSGDPLKDFWDEIELIERLYATVLKLEKKIKTLNS